MDTESLTVLIVAKTRRGHGACVGAITADGRSVRLQAANAASDEHAGLEYQVGDVWKIEAAPHPQLVPPHVETLVVFGKQWLRRAQNPLTAVEKLMPPRTGGIEVLYNGLVQVADSGALYIAERTGVPACSTLFWRPDRPLHLAEDGVRLHYGYQAEDGKERRLAYVGFQEPLAVIPAGTLLRVSLAHWWRPPEQPEQELRCHLQVSGWFLTATEKAMEADSTVDKPRPDSAAEIEANLYAALKDVFGYDSFRPLQEQIMHALLQRRDTLAVMPTGAGKSLCYQLPATIWSQMTVVVSPLISLMQDQVETLRTLRVPAAYLNSTLSYAEQRRLMDDVRAGRIKLLYMAPETLLRPEVLHLLDQVGVACLAVDEAHCISAWGHDFRPEYRQLEPVRRRFGSAVCLAMTATAAPRVRADIKKSLGIEDADEIVASFDRPNLFLSAQPRTNGEQQLLAFLEEHRDQSGIIYCTSRSQVESLSERLRRRGHSALPYHGGMDDGARQRNQRAFTRDEVPIIVATIAFGMGINKPNVRFVVHYNLPGSIEAYYQEIGRSGRDGLRADCLLLYHMQDVQVHARMIADEAEEERPGRNARLQAMLRFAQAHTCRRPLLLHYFGEETAGTACGFCDNCMAQDEPRPQVDVTDAAQKFLACVMRTGETFGASHIIDILRGSQSRKVLDRRHDTLPLYAAGKEHSAAQWRTYVQQWIQQQLLEQDMEHGSLRLTPWGREVLRSQRRAYAEPQTVPTPNSSHAGADGRPGVVMPDYDKGLFEHLRGLRRSLAQAGNLPPYMVFSDRALAEMAAYLPHTPEALLAINGVGRAKLETYGERFIAAITAYCAAHDLQPQLRPQASSLPHVQPALLTAKEAKEPAAPPAAPRGDRRSEEVGELFAAGATLGMLQESFAIKRSTVLSHLRDYFLNGGALDVGRLHAESGLPEEVQGRVGTAFAELGSERLAPVYEALQGQVAYDDLHLLRLVWLAQRQRPTAPGGAGNVT